VLCATFSLVWKQTSWCDAIGIGKEQAKLGVFAEAKEMLAVCACGNFSANIFFIPSSEAFGDRPELNKSRSLGAF